MGQKIHPLGLRVGITKKHQSQWFSRFHKNKYAQTVLEDNMLRQTLTRLVSHLYTQVFKKKLDNASSFPQITQIKIERGLIPYEIGIQIHAKKGDNLKSLLFNLENKNQFVSEFQKTFQKSQRKTDIKGKGETPSLVPSPLKGDANAEAVLTRKQSPTDFVKKSGKKVRQLRKGYSNRRRGNLLILKRLQKRQFIHRRYNQLVHEARFFLQKQGTKVIQKFKKNPQSPRLNSFLKGGRDTRWGRGRERKTRFLLAKGNPKRVQKTEITPRPLSSSSSKAVSYQKQSLFGKGSPTSSVLQEGKKSVSLFQSRLKKKCVTLYRKKRNQKFLQVLKSELLKRKDNDGIPRFPPKTRVSYESINTKWNFKTVKPRLDTKSLRQLQNYMTLLEQKCLKKMESLRHHFLTFGTLSPASFSQMVTFLKDLKDYIVQRKRKQKVNPFFQKSLGKGRNSFGSKERFWKKNQNDFDFEKKTRTSDLSLLPNLTKRVSLSSSLSPSLGIRNSRRVPSQKETLSSSLKTREKESLFFPRELAFIEYLKHIVKKHRSANHYFYLSTIADARTHLRKLKQFTKQNASFLFGSYNLPEPELEPKEKQGKGDEGQKKKREERIRFLLKKRHRKSYDEKTLQDVFLEQIEKQRTMYRENSQLIPKIALKFYTVKEPIREAKASVVADSIREALEKRKAFRKVIKDVKEQLMRGHSKNEGGKQEQSLGKQNSVKGVKIQVSGRLNGAEIARSEWVRAGRVPLQTLRANIDYASKTAHTIYGIIGIKVWIFKGYTKCL